MAAYAPDPVKAQRRTIALVAVAVFHVFLIWGIANGLVPAIKELVAQNIETTIIKEEKPPEELPPPPPPDLERPPVQVVQSEINIALTVDAPPPPITNTTTTAVVSAPVAPPRPPPPGTKLGVVSFPNVDDYYPSSARSANQEGRPVIKLCVDDKGKLVSADIAESSKYTLLDEAALKVAKLGRYKAPTTEGRAVAGCANLPVKFELKKK